MRDTISRAMIRVWLVLFYGLQLPVASGATLTEHMDIECRQPDALRLVCRYRLLNAGELRSAVAEAGGHVAPGEIIDPYPQPGDTTAVLILVDTSDPARRAAVAKIGRQVANILSAAGDHHRFGLATFDTALEVKCPIGSTTAEMLACTDSLAAMGHTTELYRNVLEAIELTAAEKAERRLIVLMSDGMAEDFAYQHGDVVSAARERQIVITSIGYPRSVTQSVALQTLRTLSEQTGGLYAQADHTDLSLPDAFFPSMLAAIDSGGVLRFDLGTLAAAGLGGPVDVSLGFQTSDQNFLVLVPVQLPASAASTAGAPVTKASQPAPTTPPRAEDQRPPETRTSPITAATGWGTWIWFGTPAAVLLLILSGLTVYILATRKRDPRLPNHTLAHAPAPRAFLVMQGDATRRFTVSRTPWRIGRGKNNDLTLDDNSVSRLHAEIRRNEQGNFTLCDLESLNGVFVNEQRVAVAELQEGDLIDIGDIGLCFTLQDEDHASQDPTVPLQTRTPV